MRTTSVPELQGPCYAMLLRDENSTMTVQSPQPSDAGEVHPWTISGFLAPWLLIGLWAATPFAWRSFASLAGSRSPAAWCGGRLADAPKSLKMSSTYVSACKRYTHEGTDQGRNKQHAYTGMAFGCL